MFNLNLNLSILYFIISCLMFSYFFKHILLTLISLEFIMLNITLNLYMNFFMINFNLFFISLFFTIMICESILGLSLLIFMIRNNGNDYMKMLNLIKW